jgi:serine/threonine protein kinase
VLPYFGQLLDGVEAAHLHKVIHRDLKPENVLYDAASDRLVIAAFGVARFEEETLYTLIETMPNTRLATFLYSAPEQRVRGGKVDQGADIYALGLILIK